MKLLRAFEAPAIAFWQEGETVATPSIAELVEVKNKVADTVTTIVEICSR
jgi:hypothetical protein